MLSRCSRRDTVEWNEERAGSERGTRRYWTGRDGTRRACARARVDTRVSKCIGPEDKRWWMRPARGLTPRNDSTLVHSRQEPRARGSRPTNYATALSLAIHLSDLLRRTAISPFVPFEIERLLISRAYLHLIQREYENRIVWRRFYIVFQNKSRWSYGS